MLTAAHHAWLAAAQDAGDPPGIVVDYLQEAGATLAEVLLLYAGTPREFVDGLPHEVLVAWCQATEPCLPSNCHEGGWPLWRWEAVRDTLPDTQVPRSEVTSAATVSRDRLRRVLSLFPEVWLPCPDGVFGSWAPDLIPPEPP